MNAKMASLSLQPRQAVLPHDFSVQDEQEVVFCSEGNQSEQFIIGTLPAYILC